MENTQCQYNRWITRILQTHLMRSSIISMQDWGPWDIMRSSIIGWYTLSRSITWVKKNRLDGTWPCKSNWNQNNVGLCHHHHHHHHHHHPHHPHHHHHHHQSSHAFVHDSILPSWPISIRNLIQQLLLLLLYHVLSPCVVVSTYLRWAPI